MEGQHAPAGRRKLADLIAFLILLGVALAMLVTSPRSGNFWNSDSPRHAMNGVFVKDLIASHPFHNPVRYAVDYYLKYPALTIGLYPSLFFLLSAPFFALFGVSHLAALLPVTILFFVYITGCYAVARRWLNWPLALAAALAAARRAGDCNVGQTGDARYTELRLSGLVGLVYSALRRYRTNQLALWGCSLLCCCGLRQNSSGFPCGGANHGIASF